MSCCFFQTTVDPRFLRETVTKQLEFSVLISSLVLFIHFRKELWGLAICPKIAHCKKSERVHFKVVHLKEERQGIMFFHTPIQSIRWVRRQLYSYFRLHLTLSRYAYTPSKSEMMERCSLLHDRNRKWTSLSPLFGSTWGVLGFPW